MSIPGLFVTGTDTEVGKTWVTAAIVAEIVRRGLRVGALKPVSTSAVIDEEGARIAPDARVLKAAMSADVPLSRISPLVLEGDVAPSVAMRLAGKTLHRDELVNMTRTAIAWWRDRADVVVVEGVGGWLCPIAPGTTVADLAVALDFPVLIVARRGLGTLNHTALTVESAQRRGVRIAGIVLNSVKETEPSLAIDTNPIELANLVPEVPILAEILFNPTPATLSQVLSVVDWSAILREPRLHPSSSDS